MERFSRETLDSMRFVQVGLKRLVTHMVVRPVYDEVDVFMDMQRSRCGYI